jgi:putative hydrolase of the HAD superfamily
MIKTIIFDLGKVLVPFDFQRAYDRLAPLSRYSPEQIRDRVRGCDLVTRFESGQVEPEAFAEEFCGMFDANVPYDQFCETFSAIFFPDTLIPDSLLEALKQRYRLVLLSNTNAIHWEMLARTYPLLRHFDEKVLSYRVKALKPDPRIYHEAIRAAECLPAECFYTDDIADYVAAARQQGIDAVQFQSREQIESELRRRGVDW